jgi:hypothetical protein
MENIKKNDFLNIFNTYNPNEKIIESISIEKNQNLSFAGVDAGFVNQQFNFSNITIVKEVGALFEYQDSKLKHTTYFPKTYNLARPYLTTSSLELEEVMWNTSILRLNKEIGLSIDIVKNKKPNFMLLDGSIVPQYISKPSKDSKLFSIYKQLINNFVSLYNISKENKIYLVGCIEDSRSDSFFNFLKDKILNKQISNELYDSFVTFSLLKKNQRTCVFKYTDVSTEHPILKDFPKQFIDNLYICYIKLSEDDFPLRLEFIYFKEYGLTLKEYTDYIVSNISSISNFNKKYIYPAPLIEADLRSRLRKDEIESIITSVLERTRKYGFRLPRRENRMF